ncbi:MAG: glutamate--tRNA ligase [Bacilli bacterium]|nr:glutamate--tRNA ligase [Bacilli bacterium]
MFTKEELAEFLFPEIHETLEDLEKRYPRRQLKEGAYVTRFAPSPTGFLHTGSLFTALIAYRFAKQSDGVYFFRLEDTDQKREIAGTGLDLVKQLKNFGIVSDEGYFGDHEEGNYAPYVQSKRADIYKVVIKELIKRGRAYPCFCTKEEMEEMRAKQEAKKEIPGYYGEYAKCRNLTPEQAKQYIEEGKPYVIRFRSEGNHLNHIRVHDEIRGDMDLTENDQDIVIYKSDGLPTYHFAHLVDDHFMGTNLVTRGEEWISSLAIHIELFKTMGWQAPKYAHLPVIMVTDKESGNRRKLSKRKDPEAAVSFFLEQGYPKDGVLKYLMTIANSNFEAWLLENPKSDISSFKLSFEKFSLDGALFDMPKLDNISKEVLGNMDKKTFTDQAYEWAKEYSEELTSFIERDRAHFEEIINIERDQEKPRKDYNKFSDVCDKIRFFFPDKYDALLSSPLPFNEFISHDVIKEVLQDFVASLDLEHQDETSWFESMKVLGLRHNFCDDRKVYKKDPTSYNGWYADCISIVRIALCASTQSPKMFDVLRILGKEEIQRRVEKVISLL